jgi:hypothetical protein
MPAAARSTSLAPRVLAGILATGFIAALPLAAMAQVASVTIKNLESTERENVPITLSHLFLPADIPAEVAVTAGATALPTQTDAKQRHSDGSLKHALVSFVLPKLPANDEVVCELHPAASSADTGSWTAAELAALDLDVNVIMKKDGDTYQISARDLLLADSSVPQWLSGPTATEFLLAGAPENASGSADPHLWVQFQVRVFSAHTALVSVVVENAWALHRQNETYDVTVTLGRSSPRVVLQETGLEHHHDSRWRRTFWWGMQPPRTEIHYDLDYFIRTGAIPRYDASVTVTKSVGVGDTSLMGNGTITMAFPSTGGRPDIGIYPAWAVRYMLTFEKQYQQETWVNGQQAGSVPVHLRDPSTKDIWSIDDHPSFLHPGSHRPSTKSRRRASGSCGLHALDSRPIPSAFPRLCALPLLGRVLLPGRADILGQLQLPQPEFRLAGVWKGLHPPGSDPGNGLVAAYAVRRCVYRS